MSTPRSRRERYKRLDWAKFTNFESQRSTADLARLCRGKNRAQLLEVLTTHDEAGLYPIHWAAIHNRSDMIEFMVESGSPLRVKCKNKLFADGTALHLAAMNGSIEAASMLLRKCRSPLRGQNDEIQPDKARTDEVTWSKLDDELDWMKSRDAEGQTALMRSAPPRSKRMNTVRDLLGKNLWSLSGRPAEMALFLICHGADWRETDSVYSMNLMHWAIVNDYDDIVHLLLVIDKDLINVVAKPMENSMTATTSQSKRNQTKPKSLVVQSDELESVNLDSSSTASDSTAVSDLPDRKSRSNKPLISDSRKSMSLLVEGLSPLQLATVYGRVSIISLLWYATSNENLTSPPALDDSIDSQKGLAKKRYQSSRQLKSIVSRAFWSNKNELARFFRRAFLKFILALDLGILAVIWIPTYATTDDEGSVLLGARGGAFIFSYCTSMALAFRVILKNPGYLRRCSFQYLAEVKSLLGKNVPGSSATSSAANNAPKTDDNKSNEPGQVQRKESFPLIRLQPEPEKQQLAAEKKANPQQNGLKEIVALGPRWQQKVHLEDRVRILCHKCRCIRRPRSRHCNYCNHCVQDFDHHCIYLGCCIGRNNRLDFLLTMIMLTITSIYGTVLLANSLDKYQWTSVWHYVGLVWILKYALIGGLTSFKILRRARLGVTMYEEVRADRIRKLFGPEGPPESIERSHKIYSTLRGSMWRYSPDRFLTGDLPARTILSNLKEFANFLSFDEYLLTIVCPDSTLARSLASTDSRLNLYKFV